MVVLDEAQNIFNNREWQNKANMECARYLMEHRHYGHKVIMITPAIDSLDASIRRVAEFTYKNKSFSALGNAKTVRCAIIDQCNMTREPLQVIQWRHDARIYQCYSSYFAEGTTEKKIRVNPLMDTKLYLLLIVIILSMVFGVKGCMKMSTRIESKNSSDSKVLDHAIIKENKIRMKKRTIMVNDSAYYLGEK